MTKFSGNLNDYAFTVHETAKQKGWWDTDRNFGEIIANIHSEVDEAWKEYVHNHEPHETYYTMNEDRLADSTNGNPFHSDLAETAHKWWNFQQYLKHSGSTYYIKPEQPTKDEVSALVDAGILEPHGVPTEFADIIIRVLDMISKLGLDAEEVVQEKMRYNLTRPHRHGGKRA